jgi:hypothetical protein
MLVPFIGIIGAGIARFRAHGMFRALFATAITQASIPVVALIIWRPSLDDPPGIVGVFVLNAFFVGLFILSAFLFRHSHETDAR